MHIHILLVANRVPDWVAQGTEHYLQRLPGSVRPRLHQLPLGRGADPARARREEGERLLKALPEKAHVVALDVSGAAWSTARLAAQLKRWQHGGKDVYLLIGGPEGLSKACLERAEVRWSLSALTLPHALVQVVLAEALYRAWSITAGHPYHR